MKKPEELNCLSREHFESAYVLVTSHKNTRQPPNCVHVMMEPIQVYIWDTMSTLGPNLPHLVTDPDASTAARQIAGSFHTSTFV